MNILNLKWVILMKVLITGTSQGIGKEMALLFLDKGHEVIGFDILPSTIENKLYTHFIKNIKDKDLPKIDGIEILINNAGCQNEDDIETNLIGTINITEYYAFQKSIKSVLFNASASSRNGAEFPYYVASKGGMVAYMKNCALRLAKYGATCNSISPGGVKTLLNKHIMEDDKMWDAVLNETLLNKWAEPEEIALWAYFLTVINKSTTGEDILIDNGEMLKSNFIW